MFYRLKALRAIGRDDQTAADITNIQYPFAQVVITGSGDELLIVVLRCQHCPKHGQPGQQALLQMADQLQVFQQCQMRPDNGLLFATTLLRLLLHDGQQLLPDLCKALTFLIDGTLFHTVNRQHQYRLTQVHYFASANSGTDRHSTKAVHRFELQHIRQWLFIISSGQLHHGIITVMEVTVEELKQLLFSNGQILAFTFNDYQTLVTQSDITGDHGQDTARVGRFLITQVGNLNRTAQ